ncbi:hypothetical protein [Thiothrix subterranea]|uniref:Uncharacterized protein n=1 Tax=Thiothrix subterranea TaxID=2735563 RepID=A0AA51MLF2_9GAMM|nr:hypothetical protein [Thiothrix subterranea]MDQ5767867.1 hypothetical protein [Thiothrix subterranea]WML86674.1 hypothetical protein RCG00_20610 [Thiothrix subterranea]
MLRVETPQYAVWQRSLFWLGWLSLLIPGYFISYGFTLVGSLVLSGYTETVDLVLVLIMGTALLELLLIAIYTLTRFWFQEASFGRLALLLVLGAAGIPLAALLGCVYAYAKLVLSM